MSIRQYKAAVLQAEPCWFDKEAATQKTTKYIKEAAANGALLLGLSECWIPGYPNFLWGGNYRENIPLVHKCMQNCITAHGPEMARIRQAAADNNIYVMLGYSERAGGTLYISNCFIDNKGKVLMARRKLKPTHIERTLFGDATGDSLNNVVDTPLGKIGVLNCWEHFQPLLKYHTYAQGEQVHIAAWPFNGEYLGLGEPWSVCNQANEVVASQMYALEGQAYVLVSNQCVSPEGAKTNSAGQGSSEGSFMLSGGGGNSGVFAPDGKKITEQVDALFEGLIYVDINLDDIDYAKAIADPVGHYSRPDLLRLLVDDQPKHYRVKVRKESVDNAILEVQTDLTSTFKSFEEAVAEHGISVTEAAPIAVKEHVTVNGKS
ncbi:Arylacetonitrilase [Pseudocercospora fuligena]|uniref:nitrilase n=1 Tax=Pseudocercospora fuligena TaxID=685502 RepID=A0A8H6VJN7_9PEZI|nr:Arylacetonitrilase [Pseudocercospora fuligena]